MTTGNTEQTENLQADLPRGETIHRHERPETHTALKFQECAYSDVQGAPAKNTSSATAGHLVLSDAFASDTSTGATLNVDGHHVRGLPVGMPWNASGVPISQYHIVWGGASTFGLRWNDQQYLGLATGFTDKSLSHAVELRKQMKDSNAYIKELLEIRYRDAPSNYLPADSSWWLRDSNGKVLDGYKGKNTVYKRLDTTNPELQDQVVAQARAAVQSGAVDGIMLDWFRPGVGGAKLDAARLELITKIREAIGPKSLILINTNTDAPPKEVTDQVNGYYMESTRSSTPADWSQIEKTLDYGEENSREPHINVLETWYDKGQGRGQLDKMRATATLLLTHAPDGAVVFGDPNGTSAPEHGHDFYDFYKTDIGTPVGPLQVRPDGSSIREFSHGTVLYNPAGSKPVVIQFEEPRTRASDAGVQGMSFTVNAGDGDIFLR